MSCAGIILAAGASSRMGCPKALLAYQGETFVDRLAGLFARRCAEVIVVLGGLHAEAIRNGMRRPARFVENPDPSRGMLSSLQCGLRAAGDAAACLFIPVDYPAVQASTVDALCDALSEHPEALLAIPRRQGRRGHPVALRKEISVELLDLSPHGVARDVIHAHRKDTVYIDVADPGVVTDVDDPEAYRRLLLEGAAS